jgi:hypothetical protein
MNSRLATLLRLRQAFRATASGEGLAAALVGAFREAEGRESDVARKLLLGQPPRDALGSAAAEGDSDLGILCALVTGSSGANARLLADRGERLSLTIERWLKRSEARRAERKILQTRGLIMSAVLGAVLAILASLGPLVGNMAFLAPGPQLQAGSYFIPCGVMAGVSSVMLGLFMSGRGFYTNLAVSIAAYALAAVAIAPLAAAAGSVAWANI